MTTQKTKGQAKAVKGVEYIGAVANTKTVRRSIVSNFHGGPTDPTDAQTLALIEQSGTLDFWSRDEEDVYTHDDGEAI